MILKKNIKVKTQAYVCAPLSITKNKIETMRKNTVEDISYEPISIFTECVCILQYFQNVSNCHKFFPKLRKRHYYLDW